MICILKQPSQGYRNVMENCMESARTLREGLERTGRFTVISKE
jgi:glutamate decarboxylase